VVGVVGAIAKERTQSPLVATAIVTPVALSTVDAQDPLDTDAALTADSLRMIGVHARISPATADRKIVRRIEAMRSDIQ